MKKGLQALLIMIIIISTSISHIYGMPFGGPPHKPRPWRPRFNETDPATLEQIAQRIETMVKGKIVLSSINIILYTYITLFYYSLYRENKSSFSLSLVGLCIALLVYSISSNPLFYFYIGRTEFAWLSAFYFIPDLFSMVAASILLYLSRT
jgi:hypothetical protein